MKVDVFLNRLAGNADLGSLREGIRRALFRCEVEFWMPEGVPALHQQIRDCIRNGTDGLLFCGGDGTINQTLKPLLEARREGVTLPKCAVIPMGTANDLATSSGISRRVDRAARAMLEGTPRLIDVLEIREESGQTAYMITNGGVGLAAFTADNVNRFKHSIKALAQDPGAAQLQRLIFGGAQSFIKSLGSRVYELGVARELMLWSSSDWRIRVTAPGRDPVVTRSPLILISNQSKIGGNFTSAPFTRNDDGLFNVLIIEPHSLPSVARAIFDMRRGHLPRSPEVIRFETSELELEATDESRPMVFFGDGEILFRDSRKLRLRCLHPGVPFQSRGGDHS